MRYRINDQMVLLCMPKEGAVGPLVAHLGSFSQSLSEQGYDHRYVRRQLMLAACFSRWLRQRGVRLRCIRSEHPMQYLRCRHRDRQAVASDAPAFDHLMAFLRAKRMIPPKKRSALRLTPAERCTQRYKRYLCEDCALAKATIINYFPFIGDFLKDSFGDEAVKLSALRAADVVRFVQRRARHLHVKRAKLMTTALRSFFQYARLRGDVTLDLGAAVPIVASWSMAAIPRAIAPEQTKKLLASIDRKTAMGRRDYAIVLLLARLGLRAGEVAAVELNDIDWGAGQLSVHSKGGRRSEMPLPPEVGKAIAAYLRHGRPRCASRRVFCVPKRRFEGLKAPAGWDRSFDTG